ncbi:UNVERIFIED_CONTAM: hypothetical protein O8I53_06065 [Campylobacter lari]
MAAKNALRQSAFKLVDLKEILPTIYEDMQIEFTTEKISELPNSVLKSVNGLFDSSVVESVTLDKNEVFNLKDLDTEII